MMSLLSYLFVASQAFAAAKPETLLSKVDVEAKGAQTHVHFELSQPIEMPSVEARFMRRTMEWDFSNVGLKKDKLFTDVSASDISNVYISHNDPKTLRVRVNLEQGKTASNYHDRISFAQAGNRLSMIINNDVALTQANIKELNRVYEVAAADTSKIAEHLAKTEVMKVDAAASSLASTDAAAEAIALDNKSEKEIPLKAVVKDSKDASSSSIWRIAMGLATICALGFSVLVLGKRLEKKRQGTPFNADSIVVVSQKYLGPKRSLTLVRVTGEYLLLGVTDNNINLIKTLSVIDDEIPALTPNDFGAAVKEMTNKAASLEDSAQEVEDSFTMSSLDDVKKTFRKRRYIDE